MEFSVVLVVVVYNKKVEESITCKNIINNCHNLVEILIIDNSTSDLNNKEYCISKGLRYISIRDYPKHIMQLLMHVKIKM